MHFKFACPHFTQSKCVVCPYLSSRFIACFNRCLRNEEMLIVLDCCFQTASFYFDLRHIVPVLDDDDDNNNNNNSEGFLKGMLVIMKSLLFFCLILTKIGICRRDLVEIRKMKVHENPFGGIALFRADTKTKGRTD